MSSMAAAEPVRSSLPPLRVALIGCGKMGKHHLRAINASGRAVVVGIADPAASEEELRPLIGDAIIVATAAEMLARAKPDVVHIVTPPGTHAGMAMLALEAGAHVYIEKPFTPTRQEADQILAFAATKGLTVCAGHQVLFERPALAAREQLASLGRVVHVESYFSFKMVRRTITPVEQLKDILPHAVYPVVDQLRAAEPTHTGAIEIAGVTVDADGDLYALLKLGRATAVVMVTLNGRPVEQYQTIVGTKGSMRADYIGGFLAPLVGPGTGPGVLLTPFRRAWSTSIGTVKGVTKLIRGGSYPGLRTLVQRCYEAIQQRTVPPISPQSILDTVDLCERLGATLDVAERRHEDAARATLAERAAALTPLAPGAKCVLVTGGTGLLGRPLAEALRQAGYAVRVLARRVPPFSRRVPDVEYLPSDLSRPLDPALMQGVDFVVHGAAETAGGREDHQRNSIDATRNVLNAAADAGVRAAVHVSSLAVIKTSREMGRALDESVPLDAGHMGRGPYVWGKAESEVVALQVGAERGIGVRIVRPGPLVDFGAYNPPGRLGRELGPIYVAMGPKRGALSVCDVSTAARVIRSYVERFDAAPPILNMVEAPPPTRQDLMARYTKDRPDLRVLWFPGWLLRAISGPLKLVQRYGMGSKAPVDIAAAFAGERYDAALAARVIAAAGPPAASRPQAAAARDRQA